MANGYWTNHGQLTEAELAAVQLAVANGIATYAAGEIEKLAGIPNIAPLLALAEVNAYPRPFTLYQAGSTVRGTQAAATWTSPNASDNGSGKLRMTTVGDSEGVHGLTTTGQNIYIVFATTGSGLHEIATIVDTKTIDFTTDYSAVSGAPTVYLVGTTSKGLENFYTLPGGVMGANGIVEVDVVGRQTSTASYRYLYLTLDGAIISQGAWNESGADAVAFGTARICNLNDDAVQLGVPMRGNAARPAYATTKDTATDLAMSLDFTVAAADNYHEFSYIAVTLAPGL